MIFAFESQFYDPQSDEPQTPISSENFKESLTYRGFGARLAWNTAKEFTTKDARQSAQFSI